MHIYIYVYVISCKYIYIYIYTYHYDLGNLTHRLSPAISSEPGFMTRTLEPAFQSMQMLDGENFWAVSKVWGFAP